MTLATVQIFTKHNSIDAHNSFSYSANYLRRLNKKRRRRRGLKKAFSGNFLAVAFNPVVSLLQETCKVSTVQYSMNKKIILLNPLFSKKYCMNLFLSILQNFIPFSHTVKLARVQVCSNKNKNKILHSWDI